MRIILTVCAVLLLIVVVSAHGETTTSNTDKPAGESNQWTFSVIPYVWGVSVHGKVTVGHYSTSSSMSFSDIIRDMKAAGELHLEAQKGSIGFFLDPTYTKLRQNTTVTRVPSGAPPPPWDVTLTSEMWLVEFGGFYQAGKWFLDGKKEGRTASVDVLAGGRYWYMHGDLDTSIPYSSSKTNQFVDPIIGARATIDLTDKFSFRLKGDIGGFGVGSDFTWNALAGFGYQFSKGVTALLGYRYLYMDYKTSTSSARYHITMQGPIGGVMFNF